MPRTARLKSKSGIYHVIVRGVNKTPIYRDNQDCLRFLTTLKRVKRPQNFKLFAYCLMKTHAHLMIQEQDAMLAKTMQRLNISYVQYFNGKYERTGHLFQDRYRSEVIQDGNYFLTCARYIHNNPVKAGLVSQAIDYPWSSFPDYMSNSSSLLVDKDTLLSQFAPDITKAIAALQKFTNLPADDLFIDENTTSKELSNIAMLKKAKQILKKQHISPETFMTLDTATRHRIIEELFQQTKLSDRDIATILDIGRSTVYLVLKHIRSTRT